MSSSKGVFGKFSRLLENAKTSRTPISHRNELNTGKKDESKTILSPEANTVPRTFLTIDDIPGPKPSIPFIGTGWQYFPGARYSLDKMHDSAFDKYQRYGPIVKEEFQWRKPVVTLFDPDDFEVIFRNQGMTPLRPISEFVKHYRASKPELYDTIGLSNSVGEEWKCLRDVLGDALMRMNSLDHLIPKVDAIGDDFVTLLRKERNSEFKIENFQDYVYRVALEGVYMMSLDTRLGCLDPNLSKNSAASDMIASVKLLFEAFQELYYGLPLWKYINTPSYKKLHKAESIMYSAANDRIQSALEKLRASSQRKKKGDQLSILETLLRTKGLSDKKMVVTVIDFLSGGIFTMTNAFTFLIHHVSKHPEVQEKLYEEMMKRVPDGKMTADHLHKSKYLYATVKESFRLSPIIPSITRIMPQDVILSGYHVPKGTPVFCNFVVPCKQAERYPEPERFNPDRWIQKTHRTNPFTLVPFGFGLRMCVGRNFAEMEMFTALCKLIYNFKIENPGQNIKGKQAFIVVPSEPVSIIFKDRKRD